MSLFHNRLLPPALAVYALVSLAAHAQTQAAMNEDACAQYKNADQALNATYMKVLKDYGRDPQFLAKLKQAQRAWIAFGDAHLAARFPKADKQAEYGSVYPTCRCAILTELTEAREKELKVWADGIPEGDVCNGSVKTAVISEDLRQRTGRARVHSCQLNPDRNGTSALEVGFLIAARTTHSGIGSNRPGPRNGKP
jgi:uncharacterized protein YecT (DUF1311 family)